MWDDVVNRTPRERNELFLHEWSTACAEARAMLPALATEHLDEADGRYWLRLEWRALARALRGTWRSAQSRCPRRARLPAGSTHSLRRQCRRRRGQEITEGLAAHTGTGARSSVCGRGERQRDRSPANAEAGALDASFVRTFAYMSGPAYGLLLDAASPGWTRRVRSTDDLGTLAMRAFAVQPAIDATASAARYGGAETRASEQQREQQRQERLAELRRRFVDGPVLVLPGAGSGSYDTRGAIVIPGVGTVYSDPIASQEPGAHSKRTRACSSRVMAARVGCRCQYAATTWRSPEMAGRSRRRRAGWCAKAHGGPTSEMPGSSREPSVTTDWCSPIRRPGRRLRRRPNCSGAPGGRRCASGAACRRRRPRRAACRGYSGRTSASSPARAAER